MSVVWLIACEAVFKSHEFSSPFTLLKDIIKCVSQKRYTQTANKKNTNKEFIHLGCIYFSNPLKFLEFSIKDVFNSKMSDSSHITLQMDKLDSDKSTAQNHVSLTSFTGSTVYVHIYTIILHPFAYNNSLNCKF